MRLPMISAGESRSCTTKETHELMNGMRSDETTHLEDGLVDSRERARARARLGLVVVVAARRLGQDAAVGDQEDGVAAELLLELAHQLDLPGCRVSGHTKNQTDVCDE